MVLLLAMSLVLILMTDRTDRSSPRKTRSRPPLPPLGLGSGFPSNRSAPAVPPSPLHRRRQSRRVTGVAEEVEGGWSTWFFRVSHGGVKRLDLDWKERAGESACCDGTMWGGERVQSSRREEVGGGMPASPNLLPSVAGHGVMV